LLNCGQQFIVACKLTFLIAGRSLNNLWPHRWCIWIIYFQWTLVWM